MFRTHPETERVVVWLLLSQCDDDGTYGIAMGDADGYRCNVARAEDDATEVAALLATYVSIGDPDNPDDFLYWLADAVGDPADAGLAYAGDVYYPQANEAPGGTADLPPREGAWLTLPSTNGICEVRSHAEPGKCLSIKRAALDVEWARAAREVAKSPKYARQHRERTRVDWERIHGPDVAKAVAELR